MKWQTEYKWTLINCSTASEQSRDVQQPSVSVKILWHCPKIHDNMARLNGQVKLHDCRTQWDIGAPRPNFSREFYEHRGQLLVRLNAPWPTEPNSWVHGPWPTWPCSAPPPPCSETIHHLTVLIKPNITDAEIDHQPAGVIHHTGQSAASLECVQIMQVSRQRRRQVN